MTLNLLLALELGNININYIVMMIIYYSYLCIVVLNIANIILI